MIIQQTKKRVIFDELIEEINKLENKNSKEGTMRFFELLFDKKGSNILLLHALKKASKESVEIMENEQLKLLFEKNIINLKS